MSLALHYSLSPKALTKSTSTLKWVNSDQDLTNSSQKSAEQPTKRVKEKSEKIQTTDTQAFIQKHKISLKDNELTCFQLINLSPALNKVSLQSLNRLEFSVLSYTVPQLVGFSKLIIDATPERQAIGKAFNIKRLIELISESYNIVAYHNFSHAFSVMLLLHQSYNRSPILSKCITEKQWFYVYLAALAHDIHHPGTTNSFEVKSNSKLAQEAGNESVLQKMHLSYFWNILKNNSQVNFLQGYTSYESSDIRKLITRMILATDVTKHFRGVQNLKQINKHKQTLEGETSLFVMQQLFHACDIGNPCLDFDNYMNWSALVSYEFNEVTKKQKQLGLPVTSFLIYENLSKFYGGQIGFCNGLVLPLWMQLNVTFPGLDQMKNNVRKNIKELQKKKQDSQ